MAKKNIRDIVLTGKKVLMRVDFNVPMKNGVITDTYSINDNNYSNDKIEKYLNRIGVINND